MILCRLDEGQTLLALHIKWRKSNDEAQTSIGGIDRHGHGRNACYGSREPRGCAAAHHCNYR